MSGMEPQEDDGLPLVAGLRLSAALAATLLMHLLLVALYYLVVTPLAVALRAARLEALGLRRDERARTYWRRRRRA